MFGLEYTDEVLSTSGMTCENCLCPGYGVGGLSGTTLGIVILGNNGKGLLLTPVIVKFFCLRRRGWSILSCAVLLVFFPSLLSSEEGNRSGCGGSLHFEKWRCKAFSLMLRSRARL